MEMWAADALGSRECCADLFRFAEEILGLEIGGGVEGVGVGVAVPGAVVVF